MQKPLQVKVIEWRFDLWAGSATRLSAILPVVWLIGCCQLTGAEGVQTERRESLRANLARLKSGVSWVEISGDDDQWSSVEANVTNADEVAELVTSLEFERDEEPESFGVGIKRGFLLCICVFACRLSAVDRLNLIFRGIV